MIRNSMVPIRTAAGVFLLAIAMLFGAGCASFITDQQEIELGQKYAQELSKELVFVNDPVSVGYINSLGRKLAASTVPQRPNIQYSFFIVKDDTMNAFAIPGGNVYVHTAIIKNAKTENELAAVLAHEVGHVADLHHKSSMAKQMGAQMVNDIIFGDQAQNARVVADLVAKGVLLKYSREQEYEADQTGLQTMVRAGYDPAGMVTFFETMQTGDGGASFGMLGFISSHPETQNRIARARQIISTMTLPPNLIRDRDEFQLIRARF